MKFSIVVPAHNNPTELHSCLKSISQINFPRSEFEVIVVDNNSTNDTAATARKFGANVVVEKELHSSHAARNRGIQAAKGELIAFTDSDCIVDEQWLMAMAAAADDGVGCLAGEILSTPPATLVERFSEELGLLGQRGPLSGQQFKPYARTTNAVYRKQVFNEIGLFDPSSQSGGDAAFAWRMQDRTPYTLRFVPSAIVYRHHRNSVPELWEQFRRHGAKEMSWALAQPDYAPPAIAKLEADAMAALDKAIVALEEAGLDEKALLFPVLRAATRMAHLSGYCQDLLMTVSRGLPLDQVPGHARELVPKCNICGCTAFVPGPNDRMERGRAPQCAECHSLERHRVLASMLDTRSESNLLGSSALTVGEWLPPRLAKRFGQARGSRLGETSPLTHNIVVVPTFASLAKSRSLPTTIAELVVTLAEDGILILFDRDDQISRLGFGEKLDNMIKDILPNTNVTSENIIDDVTGVKYRFIIASAQH